MDEEKTVWEHLKDIRKIFLSSLLLLVVFFFIGIWFAEKTITYFAGKYNIVSYSPTDSFSAVVYLAGLYAFVLVIPLFLYKTISYIAPVFNEKVNVKRTYLVSLVLFVGGIVFGYLSFSYLLIDYLAGFSESLDVAISWQVLGFVKFLFLSALSFGVIFQLPIPIYFLVKSKAVKTEALIAYSAVIMPIVVLVIAFITPGTDALSLFLFSSPILLLYYGTTYYCKVFIESKHLNI